MLAIGYRDHPGGRQTILGEPHGGHVYPLRLASQGGGQLSVSSSSTPVWTTSGLSAESRVTSLWRSTASSGSIPTTHSKEAHTVAPPL